MTIVNMPSPRHVAERELEEFEHVAIALLERLTRLHFEEIPAAISGVLGQLARSVSAGSCRLIEFTETGSVARGGWRQFEHHEYLVGHRILTRQPFPAARHEAEPRIVRRVSEDDDEIVALPAAFFKS